MFVILKIIIVNVYEFKKIGCMVVYIINVRKYLYV